MRTLYFDCFSGVSGDMTIGALIDLGVSFTTLQAELEKLHLPGYQLSIERVTRANLAGTKFHVMLNESQQAEKHHHHKESHEHHHTHEHEHNEHHHTHEHEHADHKHQHHHDEHHHEHHHEHTEQSGHSHRTLPEIRKIIDASELSAWVKRSAKEIFERLAIAEGSVHGIAAEAVHFHEVGAIDAIVDIVGACIGFELLGVERFICSPLHVGRGFVKCAHGLFPIPAPGTLALLKGAPIYSTDLEGELVTPTGAAIVSTLCHDFRALPNMRIERIGYGAGTRDFAQSPNMLRLCYGEMEVADTHIEMISVIEANIDDMNPQIYGYLMDRILAAGALDVFYTPIQMKKNRPGTLLTLLVPNNRLEDLIALLFRETTTLGLRYYETKRRVLDRQTFTVYTSYGEIRIKIALAGREIVNAMPEYEDCVRAAQQSGVPLAVVQAAATRLFEEQREAFYRTIKEGQ
ncbi:MAG: nickel pincer cofactor biosynthesis protein LarC [Acidobacteriota bacterium]